MAKKKDKNIDQFKQGIFLCEQTSENLLSSCFKKTWGCIHPMIAHMTLKMVMAVE